MENCFKKMVVHVMKCEDYQLKEPNFLHQQQLRYKSVSGWLTRNVIVFWNKGYSAFTLVTVLVIDITSLQNLCLNGVVDY